MVSCVAPIVHSQSYSMVGGSSTLHALPSIEYTHLLFISNRNCWIKPGDSTVTVAAGDDGATYLPADTPVEVPTRRFQVEGITHFAVRGVGGGGLLNINYENAVYTDTDCLVAIYDMLRQELVRYYGKPGYSPSGIGPYKAHIDY